ncbi:MAG: hypothetical protein JW876_07595 [Candidatus Krumholzibacteriota bacterium]|nr:hypothetical protein [Candidatus Krumholzibacteriota bacterium]
MQGGKGRNRGGGGLRQAIVAVCAATAVCRCGAARAVTVWRAAGCGALQPAAVWSPPGARNRRGGGVFCARAAPYELNDLSRTGVVVFGRSARGAASAGWEAVRHTLYRRDRFEAAAIVRAVGGLFFAGAGGEVERASVTGYAQETKRRWNLFGGIEARSLALGLVRRTGGSIGWRASIRAGAFSVAVDDADGQAGPVVAGEFQRGGATLAAGMQTETGEIAIGLTVERRPVFAGVVCAEHPVLGRTVTVGAGWARWRGGR